MTKYCAFGAYCVLDENTGGAVCKCRDNCDGLLYSPVCGSDGVSYNSVCHLQRASCEQQKRIAVISKGLCGKSHDYCCPINCAISLIIAFYRRLCLPTW